MQRLLTFCLLLAVVAAQNGYDYSKPGKPFSPNPINQESTTAYRNPSTTPSFQTAQDGQYQNSGFGASGYESGQSIYTGAQATGQKYQPSNTPSVIDSYSAPIVPPGSPAYSSQNQKSGYEAQPPAYQGQQGTGAAAGFSGQKTFGASSGFSGQTGQNQVAQEQYSNQFGQQNSFGTHSTDDGSYPGGDYSAIPGEPDRDYPILTEIPQTSFRCDAQAYPGYYADVETRCQVFHVCANNRTFDFLCPNGTIFSQEVFVCVWWNQFDCNSAPSYYGLNANLYAYSKTGSNYNQGTGIFGGQVPVNYQDTTGVQGPTSYSQGAYNPQVPTTSIGGSTAGSTGSEYTGLTSNYDTSGKDPNYQANTSSQGQSASYPNTQATGSYTGTQSQSNYPDASIQGYPSGKPNGPSFTTGNASNKNNNAEYQSPPNREYLPPKN